ncbi:MAG: LPS assembly lipoprotein LptE [Myxococcota bacterium]
MRRFAAVGVLWLLAGCGYRFGGGVLPGGGREVFAPVFVNHTSEPGLETLFTEAFRQQLGRAGIDGGEGSSTRVEGEVMATFGAPTILTTDGRLASYRVHATVRLRLVKAQDVLAQTEVSGSEDYLPGADVLASESNRQAALRRLAESLMRDGYENLAASW